MFRTPQAVVRHVGRLNRLSPSSSAFFQASPFPQVDRFISPTKLQALSRNVATATAIPDIDDMPYLHFSKRRSPSQPREKFRSPQRRASKLLYELSNECVEKSKAAKPAVFGVDFAVGDAIELQIVDQGGVDSTTDVKKVRGVVIGKFSRGLATAVQIRDVVMGTIVERRLPLHSPLVRNIRVIERNFVYKGRRKVKRAKLYFLRDRNPNESRVTKSKN